MTSRISCSMYAFFLIGRGSACLPLLGAIMLWRCPSERRPPIDLRPAPTDFLAPPGPAPKEGRVLVASVCRRFCAADTVGAMLCRERVAAVVAVLTDWRRPASKVVCRRFDKTPSVWRRLLILPTGCCCCCCCNSSGVIHFAPLSSTEVLRPHK